jgi:hypothetical protein
MGRRRSLSASSSSSSSSLSGSWHRKLVFGIPLLNSLSVSDIEPLPPAIDACLHYLEDQGMKREAYLVFPYFLYNRPIDGYFHYLEDQGMKRAYLVFPYFLYSEPLNPSSSN